MNLRTYLLSTVAQPAMRLAMPRMTAREMADALALAYRGLHLDRMN